MRNRAVYLAQFVVLLFALSTVVLAQSSVASCGVPPTASSSGADIFSEQQEMWLGQVEADLLEADMRSVRDQALSAHLQQIADRLLATLPPTKIQFKVRLIDSNEVNAFSIAGGNIYVHRKLAAIAQNDDELAGVIGHEIGHIFVHHAARDTTREMKRLLGVTSVGDKEDIRKKFDAMIDAEYVQKHSDKVDGAPEEAQADRIGVYASAAAGYKPGAYAEFWNRAFFVNGKTGNKLGDFFHVTKPDQKRLRFINAFIVALPSGCGQGANPPEGQFAAWHKAVVENQAGTETARSAALHAVTLTPPLRMELDQLRFSPDGKSILAQDQSSVFALNREPFALRYRIDASQALPANFSPDSHSVTFSTPGLHTEQWSADERKLLSAHELVTPRPCYDNRLSPDGRTLLCVQFDLEQWQLGVQLIDTSSSEVIWKKDHWMEPNLRLATSLMLSQAYEDNSQVFLSSYSADGRTLLFAGGDEKLAFDLDNRTVVKTGYGIRGLITGAYAFLGNNRIAGADQSDLARSGIFSFPDGQRLQQAMLPREMGSVSHPGDKEHVLAYGIPDYGVALIDAETKMFLMRVKTRALDEDRGTIVAEGANGTVVMQSVPSTTAPAKQVELPLSPLPDFCRVALSKDGKYIAVSTRLHGGVWDVETGQRVGAMPGFTDASWTDEGELYMDVPKDRKVERHMVQLSMGTRTLKGLPYKMDDETHMRYGRLTDWKSDEKKKSWTLSLHDPADGKVIWSRVFPDRYFTYTSSYGDRDLIFNFQMSSRTAKEALKQEAKLAQELQEIKNKDRARLIQILNGNTGLDDGKLVVELPANFDGTAGLNRAGDLLYVEGVDDRTKVYSISSGRFVRELSGYLRALDPVTGRVLTANRVGEGVVYDAAGTELAHYQFGEPIRYALFRKEATLVTVLTADQKVRTMQVAAAIEATKAAVGEKADSTK